MKTQILELATHGQSFGYVTVNDDSSGVFYGNGHINNAAKFELTPCARDEQAFYYKLVGSHSSYMDFSLASKVVKITRSKSPEASNICAWKMLNGALCAIIPGSSVFKALSRSTFKHGSNVLFATSPCDQDFCRVRIITH
ncbi:hypothetical protein [Pseudoalteromonas obscura]|uniref:Uncharacterized protein n=1 Tax=Pseudoalteromonas obscura TaxID=3048491 RepID=A0ABT7EJX5_9GAMM|nr:hypothetical protein [Pseudoalteromonas sp. P94(2023)]MDK2595340.1 hypothetical protein [Pseudoalteromonas sp. P94(2023)]